MGICIHVNVCHECIVCHVYIYTALSGCAAAAKAGSGGKTALAAAGPPVSAWSTPWYPITIWARLFATHASLPASSDMKPRSHWRPKGPWEKNAFLVGKQSWLRIEGSWPISPGGSLWEGEGNGNYRNATIPVTIPGSIPGNYGKSHPWIC